MITSFLSKAIYYSCCLWMVLQALVYTSCDRNTAKYTKPYSASDAQQLKLLNNQWYAWRYINLDSAMNILKKKRKLETSYSTATGDINYYAGMTFLFCNMYENMDSGKMYADSAWYALAQSNLPTQLQQSKTYYAQGIYFNAIKEPDSAIKYYLLALNQAPQPVDTDYVNSVQASVSMILFSQGNYEQAHHYFEPILKEALLYKNPPKDMAALINGFGYCLNAKGPLHQMRSKYLFAAKKLADSLHIEGMNSALYSCLATYYYQENMADSGDLYCRKAIDLNQLHPMPTDQPEVPYVLLIQNQIKTGDWTAARASLSEMQRTTDTSQYQKLDLVTYYELDYKIKKHFEEPADALAAIELYSQLQNQIMEEAKNEQLLGHEKQMKRLNNMHLLNAKDYKIKTQRNYLVLSAIIALLILTASIFVYYYRKRKQELERKYWAQLQKERDLEHQNRLHEERNRISREMHDDLGTTLTSTVMAVELVQHFPENKKYLEDIRKSADDMYQKINEIVWNLNVQNDNIGSLNNYMIRFSKKFLGRAGLALTWKEDIDNEDTMVPGHQRRVIYLAFKELINNLVKHAKATKVHIELYSRQSFYRLSVEDDGIGIDPAKVPMQPKNGHGYGLGNILRNITGIGGRVQWTTPRSHSGTSVIIEIEAIS